MGCGPEGSSTTLIAYSLVEDPDTTETEYGAYLPDRNLTPPSRHHNFIAGHGTTLWSAHKDGGLVVAYDLTDYSRDRDKEFQLPTGVTVGGLWADGERLWVAQKDGSKISVVHRRINASGLAVAGTPLPGEGLSANLSGLTDPNGIADDVSYRYQWLRDCEAIPGATDDSYVPTEADLASALTLRVSFTDEAGNEEEVFADPSTRADRVIDVPWHWDLVPDDRRQKRDEFRLIFLTETGFAPDSTDIEDYNRFVQEQARAPDTPEALRAYHRWFRVLGSTADVDAIDNTATNFTGDDFGVPVYWLKGDRVADQYADFYDGGWAAENAPTDRRGMRLSVNATTGRDVITGSFSLGIKDPDDALGDDTVTLGRLDGVNSSSPVGAANSVPNTDTSKSYYALSPVFRVTEGRPASQAGCRGGPSVLLCATLTSGAASAVAQGYISADYYPDDQAGSLSEDTFTYLDVEYTVVALYSELSGGTPGVRVAIRPQIPASAASDLRLVVALESLEDFSHSTTGDFSVLAKTRSDNLFPGGNQISVVIHDRRIAATGPPLVGYHSVLNSGQLPAGSQFRVMFVGRDGGRDEADEFCPDDPQLPECDVDRENLNIRDYNRLVQEMARWGAASRWDAAGAMPIGGERRAPFFRALISTAGTDARDNTATTYTYSDDNDDTNDDLGVPIYWLTGKKVADDYWDFYDGTWDNPTDGRHPYGMPLDLSSQKVGTGSRSDGTVDPTGFLGHPSGLVRTGSGDDPLGGGALTPVAAPFRIYGLSPIFEVRPPKPQVEFNSIGVDQTQATIAISAYAHQDVPLTSFTMYAQNIPERELNFMTLVDVDPSLVTSTALITIQARLYA